MRALLWSLLCLSLTAWAAPQQAILQEHSADELRAVLMRADALPSSAELNPIVIVLTGAEIDLFKRSQYREQKELVDLAARLDAFAIVDMQVSGSYLAQHQLSHADLPSFLTVVDDGAATVQKLQQQGYQAF